MVPPEGFTLWAPLEACALLAPPEGLPLQTLLQGLALPVPLEALVPPMSSSIRRTGSLPLPCSPPVR